MPINYESILSTYDDKLTLMQWLKKVEEALKSDTAKEFRVTKTGNATINFSLVFEDGSALTSGDIVLQQGESVESARLENNHLILTLTNGEDLDAGNLFNGNVNLNGDLSAGRLVATIGNETPYITGISGGNIEINAPLVQVDNAINATSITGDSIIENMSGYSYSAGTPQNINLNNIYVGACKNGNKITFVFVSEIERTGSQDLVTLGYITIPSSIGTQLTPINGQWLTMQQVYCASNYNAGVSIPALCIKNSNTSLRFNIYNTSTLTLNTTYYLRFEVTFLLSDNLAA